MRAFKRYARAGFTLVELMIVVAIIGILAALAIYGVRRYLQNAKTSECKNSIGGIKNGAVNAYERQTTAQQQLAEGTQSNAFSHDVCSSAGAVPAAAPPPGKKYQPNTADGSDFDTGNEIGGWKCLKFTITSPIYYQYGYTGLRLDGASAPVIAGATQAAALPALASIPAVAGDIQIWANGNLDNDTSLSAFGLTGAVNTTTRALKMATEVQVLDEYE